MTTEARAVIAGDDALEVSILGRRHRARVLEEPPCDPTHGRLRR